jgi:hypothetical protein
MREMIMFWFSSLGQTLYTVIGIIFENNGEDSYP